MGNGGCQMTENSTGIPELRGNKRDYVTFVTGTCSELATDLPPPPPTSQAAIALAVRNCDDSDDLSL